MAVLVADDGHATASSRVAAGLINPLAGMRFNPSPHIYAWLDSVMSLYGQLEHQAGQNFLHWLEMVRLFRSSEQVRFYQRRREDPAAQDLLDKPFEAGQSGQPVSAPWGGFRQRRTGFVDLPALLDYVREWLDAQGMLVTTRVDEEALEPEASQIRWGSRRVKQVIFCNGYRAMRGRWFGCLPFAPDKGEILALDPAAGSHLLPDRIINGAHWFLPHADGRYRFGATHDHHHKDQLPTSKGKEQLVKGMQSLLLHSQALKVAQQLAGVRPSTSDRQPFVGTHSEHPRMHIFNGFGAHGSLTIPWYSERMTQWLLQGKPLPENADIRRYGQPPSHL